MTKLENKDQDNTMTNQDTIQKIDKTKIKVNTKINTKTKTNTTAKTET
jgi:hypothetical protein